MKIETIDEMPVQRLCTFCRHPATSKYYAHDGAVVPACYDHDGTCHKYCWDASDNRSNALAIQRALGVHMLNRHPFRIDPFLKLNPDIQSDPLIGCVVTSNAAVALAWTGGEPRKVWYIIKSRGPAIYLLRNVITRKEIVVRTTDILEAMQNV